MASQKDIPGPLDAVYLPLLKGRVCGALDGEY